MIKKILFLLLLAPSILFAVDDLPLLDFAEAENTVEPKAIEQPLENEVEPLPLLDFPEDKNDTAEQSDEQNSKELDSLPLLDFVEPPDSVTLDTIEDFPLLVFDTIADSVDNERFLKKVEDFKNDPSASSEQKTRLLEYKAYGSFNENPATIACRDIFYLDIPIGFAISFRNSNLSWNEFVTMFQKNTVLSASDKGKIYGDDWDVSLGMTKSVFGIGYDNYQFASNIFLNAKIKNLGTQWLKFVLEGNSKDKMVIEGSSGEGSEVIGYVKNSLSYSIPSAFTFFERDFYFGLNLNIYNAVGYAKVENSKQTADLENGTAVVSYDYLYSKFNDFKVNSSMGFGFGVVVDALPDIYFLREGHAYLSVDDLFAKLKFSDLEKTSYSKKITYSYSDSKSNDTVTTDTTYALDNYTVKLDPEYSIGVSYSLFDETKFGSMRFVTKYRKAEFAYDRGFSLGFDYYPFKYLPFNFRYGIDSDSYFSFVIGLDWYMDFALRFVNYGHTFGGGAKGFTIGLDLLRIKF